MAKAAWSLDITQPPFLVGEKRVSRLTMATLNFAASIGRLSFESIVQRDAPGANQGRAFARFETRFQLAWALAAFIAVAIQVPGEVGFLIVGVAAAGTVLDLVVGFGRIRRAGRRQRRGRHGSWPRLRR